MKEYLSLYESQKSVEYFGLILTIPDEKGYLATDANGVITYHRYKPELSLRLGVWLETSGCDCFEGSLVCKANLNDVDWTTTLKEIK